MNTTKAASKVPRTYTKQITSTEAVRVAVHSTTALIPEEVVFTFGLSGLITDEVKILMSNVVNVGQGFFKGMILANHTGELSYLITDGETNYIFLP
jgi:hypothetical protein